MEILMVWGGEKTKPIQSQTKPIASLWREIGSVPEAIPKLVPAKAGTALEAATLRTGPSGGQKRRIAWSSYWLAG
jgi:hypothetical protein